jgi:6-phosphogluconate dehydrogenase
MKNINIYIANRAIHLDYKTLCQSLGSPKVFVFSLPHGNVGDSVLDGLLPYLCKDDIIIDAGNEHWQNTERRQGKCYTKGIRYVGMGVSGGYQAARAGPSMCPGGDDASLDMVLPLLQIVAAKDKKGNPCVGKAGTGGSGHYVKMIHNGIEHGMMSAIAEVWQIMQLGLEMSEDEIGNTLEKWNENGQLVSFVPVLSFSNTNLPARHIPYQHWCRHLSNKRPIREPSYRYS